MPTIPVLFSVPGSCQQSAALLKHWASGTGIFLERPARWRAGYRLSVTGAGDGLFLRRRNAVCPMNVGVRPKFHSPAGLAGNTFGEVRQAWRLSGEPTRRHNGRKASSASVLAQPTMVSPAATEVNTGTYRRRFRRQHPE